MTNDQDNRAAWIDNAIRHYHMAGVCDPRIPIRVDIEQAHARDINRQALVIGGTARRMVHPDGSVLVLNRTANHMIGEYRDASRRWILRYEVRQHQPLMTYAYPGTLAAPAPAGLYADLLALWFHIGACTIAGLDPYTTDPDDPRLP